MKRQAKRVSAIRPTNCCDETGAFDAPPQFVRRIAEDNHERRVQLPVVLAVKRGLGRFERSIRRLNGKQWRIPCQALF
jgi:hypothetical protein